MLICLSDWANTIGINLLGKWWCSNLFLRNSDNSKWWWRSFSSSHTSKRRKESIEATQSCSLLPAWNCSLCSTGQGLFLVSSRQAPTSVRQLPTQRLQVPICMCGCSSGQYSLCPDYSILLINFCWHHNLCGYLDGPGGLKNSISNKK